MSESTLHQAVQLIKAGKKDQAATLLKPLLASDVHNVTVWVWYVETLPTIQQKISALEMCARYNSGDGTVRQTLAVLKQRQLQSAPPENRPESSAPTATPGTVTPTPRARRPGRRDGGLWPVILLLAFVALALIGYYIIQLPSPNRNALAIGERAGPSGLDIAIQPPAELDFESKDEVLRLRTEAAYRYPDLIAGDYEPSHAVFGQIVDGLPWWGMAGQFYYGPGEKSIEGPSEESRFILNPYLLVAAEPSAMLDRSELPEETIRHPGFVFYCAPSQLAWKPQEAYAEVTYDARCIRRLGYRYFDLIAYNARDMNLNYVFVRYDDSRNIAKQDPPTSAYAIPHFIHQGGSCGYPGGCNNMSPYTPEIGGLWIMELPARVVTWLWEQEPASVEQPPDMVFVIRFE